MTCHRCGAAEAPWPIIDADGRHRYCDQCLDALNADHCPICDALLTWDSATLCSLCDAWCCSDDCLVDHLDAHDSAEWAACPVTDREWMEMKGL